jgi:hypothetical protein
LPSSNHRTDYKKGGVTSISDRIQFLASGYFRLATFKPSKLSNFAYNCLIINYQFNIYVSVQCSKEFSDKLQQRMSQEWSNMIAATKVNKPTPLPRKISLVKDEPPVPAARNIHSEQLPVTVVS